MSSGLLALLDDVAAIAKVAAASIDDIAGQTAKAGAKAAGVVIDDTAVTPRYVVGFAAERELPIVARIAAGSLRNKLLYLLPAALAFGWAAPWAITPLLTAGGVYLCYEGAEKIFEAVLPHEGHAAEVGSVHATDPNAMEDEKVASAVRTDFILSAEIMAITLASVPASGLGTQAAVLAVVGASITFGVYGAVAAIVKADDLGLALAANKASLMGMGWIGRLFGRCLVRGMPGFLKLLAAVGTAAMAWVGGGIVAHGFETFGIALPSHAIERIAESAADMVPAFPAQAGWVASASAAGVFGLGIGLLAIPLASRVLAPACRWAGSVLRRAKAKISRP